MHSAIAELDSATTAARSGRVSPWLRLVRPANLVTSGADVLAGFVLAGAPLGQLAWRLAASIGLYAGGIVLNDFFDRTLDASERPERAIPSGAVSPAAALCVGVSLLLGAVAAAFHASMLTGEIAAAIAAAVLAYDMRMKHTVLGPVIMGCCRGLNLMLGLSAAPLLLPHLWFLCLLPLTYIAGITLLSRGEVLGGSQRTSALTLGSFCAVLLGAALLGPRTLAGFLAMLPFLVLLALKAGVPLWRAWRRPQAALIRSAVHAGIVSLIVLDASLAASHAGVLFGAAILSLSVVAAELSKLFPVT